MDCISNEMDFYLVRHKLQRLSFLKHTFIKSLFCLLGWEHRDFNLSKIRKFYW